MDQEHDIDICWKCGKLLEEDRIGKNAYCVRCMRELRPSKSLKYADMTYEQRRKANVRSVAKEYRKRGKLIRKPCEVCGTWDSQSHHDDYSKPLDVRWLCEEHHLNHHGKQKKKLA